MAHRPEVLGRPRPTRNHRSASLCFHDRNTCNRHFTLYASVKSTLVLLDAAVLRDFLLLLTYLLTYLNSTRVPRPFTNYVCCRHTIIIVKVLGDRRNHDADKYNGSAPYRSLLVIRNKRLFRDRIVRPCMVAGNPCERRDSRG